MRNLGAIVLGILFLAIAALITAILFGWTGPVLNLVQDIANNVIYSLLVAIGFLLLAILAFTSFNARGNEQVSVSTSSKYGEIRITDQTIEQIVSCAGLKVDGIKEITPKVMPRPEGINIGVQALMNPDFIIPQVVEEMQESIKNEVEQYTGLKVAEVKVMVRGIVTTAAVRAR